jgi:hypothetical protein
LTEFVPTFAQATPSKLTSKPWLSSEEPQVLLFQGMRGSGKGVSVDQTAEWLYNQGLTILHIWGARSLENLFWSVNLNCKEKYEKLLNKPKFIVSKFFEKSGGSLEERCLENNLNPFTSVEDYESEIQTSIEMGFIREDNEGKFELLDKGYDLHDGNLLHCKCHKAYPILLIVPNYIEFEQETLDRFNGVYWKDLEEYKKYRIDITSEEKKLLQEGRLKKPKGMVRELIKVRHITPPTTSKRRDTFQVEFESIVLEAREDRRVVVMNPALFEFALEKFETLAEMVKSLKYLMNTSGHFMPLTEDKVGKARKYWTRKQKSWHKLAIVINEVRSVAPSSKLSGEKEAGKSKRAIYDFIPEARHMKTWFIADYQNPEDLFSGIRYQANNIIIKRASMNILGGDWTWLFEKVKNDRLGLFRRMGEYVEKYEEMFYHLKSMPLLKKELDYRRPLVDELPSNKGYVTFPNNEVKLVKFDLPSFHHKTSLEDFKQITGIRWSVNLDKTKTKEEGETEDTETKKVNKKFLKDIVEKIIFLKEEEKKSFKKIRSELIEMEKEGVFPNQNFEARTPVYFNNLYLKYRTKKVK